MRKEQMMQALDNFPIYEKDYSTILNLMDNLEDKLFVKIIEEILEGRLFFSDFERIFADETYAVTLKNNFEAQEELKKELDRTLAFRKITDGINFTIDPKVTRIGITVPSEGTEMRDFYDEIKDEVIKDQLYHLFDTVDSDTPVIKAAKLRVYNAFQSNEISEEDFLLFARDYILPISIEHQILDKSDMQFMIENNLSEIQMKKMKALSYFLRREVY
jgi:hypothetical protein